MIIRARVNHQVEGFHVGDELQMPFSTLYRWLDLQYRDLGLTAPFYIREVHIESEALLTYTQLPAGPPIPTDSDEPLLPGDYGIYNLGQ